MALTYEPGSADRYVRSRNGAPQDWVGLSERAALPQSRKYRQGSDADASAMAPNLPDPAVFGGLAGTDALFDSQFRQGTDALFDSQFRQAEVENQFANEMLEARGNILGAEAQAAGTRKAAKAQKTGAIASAAVGVAGAVGAALI